METTPEVTSAAPVSLWRRSLDWLDWKINPVLLRDLRLYTRGKLVLAAYFLTLSALVLIGVLYALIASHEGADGSSLLSILISLLAVVCGSMIPNLVFERFRAELSNRATELALMSPLSPSRLVRGKLVGAWCVSLIVLSTAAPMLATAYLLGGVNLLSIVGVVGGVVLAAAVMPTPQLFMATQRQGRSLSRGFAAIVFGVQLVLMMSYSSLLVSTFVGGAYMPEVNYTIVAALAILGVLVAQFLYFNTVSRLQSESANRDAAPRLSLSFAASVGGLAAVLLMNYLNSHTGYGMGISLFQTLALVAIFVAFTFCFGFLIVTYSSPVPPRNLLSKWAGKPLRRFFLLPGFKSLAAFFLANALVVLSAGSLAILDSGFIDSDAWSVFCAIMSPFMAISYGMLVYRIVVRFVKNKRNPSLLPVTIIIANFVIALVSGFVMILLAYSDSAESFLSSLVYACNPVGLLVATMDSWQGTPDTAMIGAVFLGISFLALLPAVFGRRGAPLGKETENADAPR